jgi:hypothetical protein
VELTEEQVQGFGVALNEATLVGVEVDPARRAAALTFSVLSLPPAPAPPPSDPRLSFILEPLGRVAVSLRDGSWDDMKAHVEPFELDRLPEVVSSFKQLPVYGWEFLDVPEADRFARMKRKLSLDWHSDIAASGHTLDLFQEGGGTRHLDLRFWFDELRIYRPNGSEVSFDDFVADGVRWWDGLHAGDERTQGHGIVPGAPSKE